MFLPLLFQSQGMPCLVVGGGDVALRKIVILRENGCTVIVIAPEVVPQIAELINKKMVKWLQRKFMPGDCRRFSLVIAATEHRDINETVYNEAKALNVPVNVVDDPELCTVIFPAIFRDGNLNISVSTSGSAPFMAAELRDRVRRNASGWGRWIQLAGRFREIVRAEVTDPYEQKRLYKLFISLGPIPAELTPPAKNNLEQWMSWLESITEEKG
ncbi:MAG: bifunctional precorrin-2 dehydrogenase/sirohydrochlorin ferrochelatase [Candidatus Electryoneaceae bacterium]|nr:bifunctional precorrin-2 dehydrogenase/sirohydrochlorin ferrochelatase [Candidatus Electryoneaceae bacterium]